MTRSTITEVQKQQEKAGSNTTACNKSTIKKGKSGEKEKGSDKLLKKALRVVEWILPHCGPSGDDIKHEDGNRQKKRVPDSDAPAIDSQASSAKASPLRKVKDARSPGGDKVSTIENEGTPRTTETESSPDHSKTATQSAGKHSDETASYKDSEHMHTPKDDTKASLASVDDTIATMSEHRASKNDTSTNHLKSDTRASDRVQSEKPSTTEDEMNMNQSQMLLKASTQMDGKQLSTAKEEASRGQSQTLVNASTQMDGKQPPLGETKPSSKAVMGATGPREGKKSSLAIDDPLVGHSNTKLDTPAPVRGKETSLTKVDNTVTDCPESKSSVSALAIGNERSSALEDVSSRLETASATKTDRRVSSAQNEDHSHIKIDVGVDSSRGDEKVNKKDTRREKKDTPANKDAKVIMTKEDAQAALDKADARLQTLKCGLLTSDVPSKDTIESERSQLGISSEEFVIAVAGVTGQGRTSFVKAISGNAQGDERGRYSDEKIVYYDIPGAGSMEVSRVDYFFSQKLFAFDAVIIIMKDRITDVDMGIALMCHKCKIPYIFVRTCSDLLLRDLRDADDDGDERDEEIIIETLKTEFKDKLNEEMSKAILPPIESADESAFFWICKGGLNAQKKGSRRVNYKPIDEAALCKYIADLAAAKQSLAVH